MLLILKGILSMYVSDVTRLYCFNRRIQEPVFLITRYGFQDKMKQISESLIWKDTLPTITRIMQTVTLLLDTFIYATTNIFCTWCYDI